MDKRVLTLMVVLVALAYLAGRHFAPEKIKIEREVDQIKEKVIAELTRQLAFKSMQTETVTVSETKPDGSMKTKTRTRTKALTLDSVIAASETKEHEALSDKRKETIEARRGIVVGPVVTFTTSDLTHPFFGGVFAAPVFGPLHVLGNIFLSPALGLGFGVGGGFEF